MADNVDVATEHSELILAAGLRLRKPEAPSARGHCLNCAEPLCSGQRWCDEDCKWDWERRQVRRC